MSSSEEDLPLVQRAGKISGALNLDSDDESVPSWLVHHKSPVPPGLLVSSDSSDIEEVTTSRKDAPIVNQPQKAPVTIDEKPQPRQSADARQRAGTDDNKKRNARIDPISTPASSKKWRSAEGAAGPVLQPASQQGGTTVKKAAGTVAAPSNELPLMLPEKLPQNKLLVELEAAEGGATDLAGDAGAVGRLLVRGTSGDQEMQIDLKGVLYSTSIIPSAVTMAVVNIGQAEAKVECLFSEFLQLREDTRFSCHETGGWDTLMGEDQEDYYAAGDYEGDEDGGDEGGGAGKKARQGRASKMGQRGVDPSGQGGGSKGRKGQGIVARGLKQRGRGVKKPREKSAAAALKGAKSKPKPNAKPKGKASALKTRKK